MKRIRDRLLSYIGRGEGCRQIGEEPCVNGRNDEYGHGQIAASVSAAGD